MGPKKEALFSKVLIDINFLLALTFSAQSSQAYTLQLHTLTPPHLLTCTMRSYSTVLSIL